MKIVVCVKQVPDTWSEKKLDPSTKTLDRESVDGVMNELDEYAVEEALKIAEATSGEVTVLSMGPSQTTETIRKALSMGSDAGIHVQDDALAGSDAIATSLAIATVLEGRGADLIIFGSESTDARMSVIPAMVAERLGLPQLTFANKVEAPGDGSVKVHRLTEYGYDVVEASTPAVVSVVEKINEPRYPSFKGIMAAKKKPVEVVTISDAGIEAASVGLGAAWSEVSEAAAAPARAAGTIVTDEGDGGVKVADYLSEQKFI
ncbi:MAG: electron transfer flavoprotein subunit beta/FixA family protein [Candidatus Nanopelagicales bacterium]